MNNHEIFYKALVNTFTKKYLDAIGSNQLKSLSNETLLYLFAGIEADYDEHIKSQKHYKYYIKDSLVDYLKSL